MKIDKEVKEEWKRFLESDEFQHDPECGTLLIAQHFAEWGRSLSSLTPNSLTPNPSPVGEGRRER